ncbi:MAG: spoVS [Firmicutes bacterium]|nr:spoVS [Bacillota bacterium]
METLKVSAKSNASSVAGAIAAVMEGGNDVELSAIGAGAVNQAIKAVAIARGYVAPHGINLACVPAFQYVEIEGEKRTGIKMIIVTY